MREAFPDMIFDGELYRDDVNKISYVLGSYQDFLDTRGRFPDLESGTWGGRGATALFGDLGVKGVTKAHAIDRCSRISARIGRAPSRSATRPSTSRCWSTARSAWRWATGRRASRRWPGIVAGDVEEDGLARAFERLGLM